MIFKKLYCKRILNLMLKINKYLQEKMKLTETVKIRVRYSETDQMGVVYHGSYVPYFEVGRVEWLRSKGLSYKKLEDSGIGLPIVNININYKRPARYDDLLTIKTSVKHFEGVKLQFYAEILDENNQLFTTAEVMLVFVDLKTGKPCMPDETIKQLLNNLNR